MILGSRLCPQPCLSTLTLTVKIDPVLIFLSVEASVPKPEQLIRSRNMNANYEYYDHIVIILPSKTLNLDAGIILK